MSTVRVCKTGLPFGGWKGAAHITGSVLQIVSEDSGRRLDIDAGEVKRYSFNGRNGLWAIRMKDGRKIYLQSSGLILSADRSSAGRQLNEDIGNLLRRAGAWGFSA